MEADIVARCEQSLNTLRLLTKSVFKIFGRTKLAFYLTHQCRAQK